MVTQHWKGHPHYLRSGGILILHIAVLVMVLFDCLNQLFLRIYITQDANAVFSLMFIKQLTWITFSLSGFHSWPTFLFFFFFFLPARFTFSLLRFSVLLTTTRPSLSPTTPPCCLLPQASSTQPFPPGQWEPRLRESVLQSGRQLRSWIRSQLCHSIHSFLSPLFTEPPLCTRPWY